MIHHFPYEGFDPLEIPDSHPVEVYHLPTEQSPEDEVRMIQNAICHPTGSQRLKDWVRPDMRLCLAVDDISRNTKTDLMLPLLLEELKKTNIPNEKVCIFVALGTHRRMTPAELIARYTPHVVDNYRIVNPDWRDKQSYVRIGKAEKGFDIRLHREIVEADFVIGVGQTIPHMIAGFGGGGKIINPGCADEDTIGQMHWLSSDIPVENLFAVRDNQVREEIDEIAIKAGLKFIINEVPSGSGRIGAVFAGHPVEAHRLACDAAKRFCEVKIKQKADIVIADAYPSDIEFWQALKGLNAACGAVRQGGTVILVTPCYEGVSSEHDEVTGVGYIEKEKIVSRVERGDLDKCVGANLFLGRQLLDKAETVLVTLGISKEDTEAMHMTWATDPHAALRYALQKHGHSATINVLYKAAKMVCVL